MAHAGHVGLHVVRRGVWWRSPAMLGVVVLHRAEQPEVREQEGKLRETSEYEEEERQELEELGKAR